jgi:hypothetical protein
MHSIRAAAIGVTLETTLGMPSRSNAATIDEILNARAEY